MKNKRRNTPAFTFLAWTSFVLAFAAMFIGIYTLDESLPVKGYYAVTALFLVMSSFVLQKTIRDNQEDDESSEYGSDLTARPARESKKEHSAT